MQKQKPKILIYDIETFPNLAYIWGKYEQNSLHNEKDWLIACFAYKWYGERSTKVLSLPDVGRYKVGEENDRILVEKLWELFDEADFIVAHNGDAFDIKKTNARFIVHGMKPPSPYRTMDTKKIAKRYFGFDSNKLDDLGRQLGCGQKLQTGGFQLWLDCMKGKRSAWARMKRYNKQDVVLLEEVYTKLRPWHTTHPNLMVYSLGDGCPICGGKLQRRGFIGTQTSRKQRYQCQNPDCGKWSSGPLEKVKELTVR